MAAAATLSTLQAICCTRVAGKSVLAIDHDRALRRVGPRGNTLSLIDLAKESPSVKKLLAY
jgi:hypothetical protein